MDAARQDFEAFTNSDFSEEWTFSVTGVTGFNITYHSFKMELQTAPGTAALVTLVNVSTPIQGFYLVEPVNGYVQVRIDKEALNTLFTSLNPSVFVGNSVRLYYDLVVTLPNGDEEVWLCGHMTVTKGITNV